jgi:serine/threonine protein kinase
VVSARVTTAVEESGRVLACKRATGPDDAERLRHESFVLERARHPGVVELVSCRDVDGATTLYTGFVGPHTLETAPPLPLEQAGAVVAMVASTLADLHSLGIVHGRVDLSHVLLGTDNRPILCGFSGGGPEGSVSPEGPRATAEFRDPAATADAPLSPTVDVYALGTLLRVLVVGNGPEIEPIPHTRFTFGRRRPWAGYLRRALLTLADQCTDEQPLRRPSARRLAADVESLLPNRLPPTRPNTTDDADAFAALRPANDVPASRPNGRRLTLVGSAVGLALIFLGLTALRSDGTRAATSSSPATSTTSTTSATTTSPSTTATTTTTTTRVPELATDGTVSIDGHRYQIGLPGDRVAIGDWECDGTRTAAIARPSTGEVFVFDRWPSVDVEVSADAITSVIDAVDVRAEDRGGCSTLVVVRRDGSEVQVP